MSSDTTPRLSVSLTFDFDALALWLGLGERNPAVISRGEFGAYAMPRILAALGRRDVKATFFVPGHTALAYPNLLKRMLDEGHEIAHHSWMHVNPSTLDEAGERADFRRALDALAQAAGVVPVGYRAPGASTTEHTISILREHGIAYDSSHQGGDFYPYYLREGDTLSPTEPYVFGPNIDLVAMPFAWHLDDIPHFEFAPPFASKQGSPSSVRETWQSEFDYAYKNAPGGIYTLCMHPQSIGRGYRMSMLEEMLDYFGGHPDVRFTTLADYALTWREANPLDEWLKTEPVHAGQHAQQFTTD